MPVPGPRDQFRDHTVRNPDHETMHFFESVPYHGIREDGRSPGTMERTLRGCVQAAGQVRQLWRQSINFSGAFNDYSWTANGIPQPTRAMGFQLTRALRYMTRSVYAWGGQDNTRLSEMHTAIQPKARGKAVTVGAGQKRTAPTVRNRLTSFGSRVQPINRQLPAAEENQ